MSTTSWRAPKTVPLRAARRLRRFGAEDADVRGNGTPGLVARLRLRAEHETWMMMSSLIALCALIVVGVFVLPFFGPRVAAVTAVILVATILLICYLICIPSALAPSTFTHPHGGPHRNA